MGDSGVSLDHMAYKTRPILADENETRWRMLPRSRKVTFCKLTDLEKRSEMTGDEVERLLDHRMWIVVIPLIHSGQRLKKFLAEQCFAIQFSSSNWNIVDKRVTRKKCDIMYWSSTLEWEFALFFLLFGVSVIFNDEYINYR